jgi:predicted N-formylglutamate amidohydrolase
MRYLDRTVVVITCEHATCFVPSRYQSLFAGHDGILLSHRGWDPGTLDLGKAIANHFGFPLFATEVTRLLIEVNRSLWHGQLFSEFSKALDDDAKQALLNRYYHKHRNAVESWIMDQCDHAPCVLHLSLHSFAPFLNGVERNADIGLLYDPRRSKERQFCERWKESFRKVIPDWRVRKNYPYLGRSDGFTTYLRKRFSGEQYCGIELEVNQRWAVGHPAIYKDRIREIVQTIEDLLAI